MVFAVLDGTDVDSGTASEIGYAYALGKRILGYRGDFRLSADNEGSIVNLQVEYFIRASGGEIFNQIEGLPEAIQRISTVSTAIPHLVPNSADHFAPEQRPRTKATSAQSSGAKLIIGILLALIVRAALEAVFKDPVQGKAAWPPLVAWFQLLIFSVMMARFYLGATRHIDAQPQSHLLWISIVNVVFASFLFGGFYVAALAVAEEGFYAALVGLHLIDAAWFVIGLLSLWILRPIDRATEIKTASNMQIMSIFLFLSLATIVWAGLLLLMVRYGILEPVTAKYLFLGGLVASSVYDFVKLRDYYFRLSDWIAKNTA